LLVNANEFFQSQLFEKQTREQAMISRRAMIAGSIATVAAAGSGSLKTTLAEVGDKAASTGQKRKFTIDLRGFSIGVNGDLNEMIDLAAKHKFESVNADSYFIGQLSEDEIVELTSSLKEKGLVWGSTPLPIEFRKDEAKFKDDLALLPKRAAAIQMAGVRRMGTYILPGHNELTYLENFKLHADRLRECAKILNDHDLRFGIEYVGPQTLRNSSRFPFLHTMKEARELNNEIGVDNMGLIMDSWHWYTAGETAEDLATLTNDEIVACDLNDAPVGLTIDQQIDQARELPMATGVIDIKVFLDGMIAAGYDGPIRAEPFNAALNALDNDEACEATRKSIQSACDLVGR